MKDFFSKCDQIRRKLRIWSHLLKKSLMLNESHNLDDVALFRRNSQLIFQRVSGPERKGSRLKTGPEHKLWT